MVPYKVDSLRTHTPQSGKSMGHFVTIVSRHEGHNTGNKILTSAVWSGAREKIRSHNKKLASLLNCCNVQASLASL